MRSIIQTLLLLFTFFTVFCRALFAQGGSMTMPSPASLGSAAGAVAVGPCNCSVNLSTGVDMSGNTIGQASQEVHWSLVGPGVLGRNNWNGSGAYGQAVYPGWVDPTGSGAIWIGPDTTGSGAGQPGVFIYGINFFLDFCTCKDYVLTFYFAADNSATFSLNGTALTVPAIGSPTSFNQFNGPYTFTGPFNKGMNSLSVVVNNIGGGTGLLFAGSVDGTCKGPDYRRIMSTGENDNATPMGYGAADPDWMIVSGPAGATYPHAPFVSNPNPAWVVGNQNGSRWVVPTNPGTGLPVTEAVGDYEYHYVFNGFDLELYDAPDASFSFTSDNEVSFYMNNETTPLATGGAASFGVWSTNITIPKSSFIYGVNVLRAVVHNGEGVSGLRVRGFVSSYFRKTISINVSTGTLGPNAMALGAQDPDWTLLVGPGYTAGPAFSIPKVTSWVASAGANWVNPASNVGLNSGDYVYELTFNVDLNNFKNYALSFVYSADNYVSFSLYAPNGTITTLGSTSIATTFSTLYGPIGGLGAFPVSGTYNIRATVHNTDSVTGLLVNGAVTAERICP